MAAFLQSQKSFLEQTDSGWRENLAPKIRMIISKHPSAFKPIASNKKADNVLFRFIDGDYPHHRTAAEPPAPPPAPEQGGGGAGSADIETKTALQDIMAMLSSMKNDHDQLAQMVVSLQANPLRVARVALLPTQMISLRHSRIDSTAPSGVTRRPGLALPDLLLGVGLASLALRGPVVLLDLPNQVGLATPVLFSIAATWETRLQRLTRRTRKEKDRWGACAKHMQH